MLANQQEIFGSYNILRKYLLTYNRKKTLTLSIIGNFGSRNIGDNLLLVSLLWCLKSFVDPKKIKVYVMVKNLENISFLYRYSKEFGIEIFPVKYYNIREAFLILIKSNFIIIGPGGLWFKYTGLISKTILPILAILLGILGKKILFVGIGLYNTASIFEKIMVNISLMFSKIVIVRDLESYNNIYNFLRKIRNVLVDKDLSLYYLEFINKTQNKIYISNNKEDINQLFKVGISLRPVYLNFDIILKELKTFKEKYKDVHYYYLVFSETENAYDNDKIILNKLLRKLGGTLVSFQDPLRMYSFITSLDAIIAMRYHSQIMAYMGNISFLPIIYEGKNICFLKEIKHSGKVIDAKNVSKGLILSFLEEEISKWKQRNSYK